MPKVRKEEIMDNKTIKLPFEIKVNNDEVRHLIDHFDEDGLRQMLSESKWLTQYGVDRIIESSFSNRNMESFEELVGEGEIKKPA
jgi:hypothetical protein